MGAAGLLILISRQKGSRDECWVRRIKKGSACSSLCGMWSTQWKNKSKAWESQAAKTRKKENAELEDMAWADAPHYNHDSSLLRLEQMSFVSVSADSWAFSATIASFQWLVSISVNSFQSWFSLRIGLFLPPPTPPPLPIPYDPNASWNWGSSRILSFQNWTIPCSPALNSGLCTYGCGKREVVVKCDKMTLCSPLRS